MGLETRELFFCPFSLFLERLWNCSHSGSGTVGGGGSHSECCWASDDDETSGDFDSGGVGAGGGSDGVGVVFVDVIAVCSGGGGGGGEGGGYNGGGEVTRLGLVIDGVASVQGDLVTCGNPPSLSGCCGATAAGEASVLGGLEGLCWSSTCGLVGCGGSALSCSSADSAPLFQKTGCGVPGDLGGGRILSVMRGLFGASLRGLF